MQTNAANRSLWAWIALGALAYVLLPWYALQDANGLLAIGQGFGEARTANGLMHATSFGKPWLVVGLLGLAIAAAGEVNGLVLRIDPFGPPASLVAQTGTPQSTPILTAFPAALSVLVRDADQQPLANVVVTFSAPAGGASTTFAPSTTATTNASGVASIQASANGSTGAYVVTAQAGAASLEGRGRLVVEP